jgi:hypothetical protein
MARKSSIPLVVEDRIYEWVNWERGMLETSSIGYPHETMESKLSRGVITDSGNTSSRTPEVLVPRHLQVIDHVMTRMPPKLQAALISHYSLDPRAKVSKHHLTKAQYWLLGALEHAVTEVNTRV